MHDTRCPKCGHETTDAGCPSCDHATVNGAAHPRRVKPPPPPELAGRVFTPTPPEMAEEFRRTFNEEEYLAAVRELELTGGVTFEQIMAEIEQKLHGRN
jgi:hypothetical protein